MKRKPTLAPIARYCRASIDHPAIGCGEREFLVISAGTKWVTVLCIATFATAKVDRVHWSKETPLKVPTRRLTKRLRENAATYGATKRQLQRALSVARSL